MDFVDSIKNVVLAFSVRTHFLIAFFIRVIFTLYGLYHDHLSAESPKIIPKYTDIDYEVFTDAAKYVYEGGSPYERATYRYTPLLAIMMQPNIFLNKSFGKILFILFDMICGLLIIKINGNKVNNLLPICFWFYNPITIVIASRGNAESVMAFLVLLFIFLLRSKQYFLSGIFYGLSVHFKIYPITYSVAILFYLIDLHGLCQNFLKQKLKTINQFLKNKKLLNFGIGAVIPLISLTIYFYSKYGDEFLNETYLYHISRQDIKHNFSPYFYMLYLTELTWNNSVFINAFCFFIQFFLILIVSYLLYDQIEFCLFLITYLFVTFNKVCTSQYFIWYLSLLPLVLPKLKLRKLDISYFFLWLFGQALWLYFAYELEFNGNNTYLQLWIAGLVFAFINCFIINFFFIEKYQMVEETSPKKKSS